MRFARSFNFRPIIWALHKRKEPFFDLENGARRQLLLVNLIVKVLITSWLGLFCLNTENVKDASSKPKEASIAKAGPFNGLDLIIGAF